MSKDKIMDALNRCELYVIPECCVGCPYDGCWSTKEECITQLHSDACTMLKAQEPVEPIRKPEIFDSLYFCGKCSAKVGFQMRKDDSWRFKYKFCPDCGRAVKWE